MVTTGGVVWCLKDDQWVPLQLSSIRLKGVLTQAHWAAVSEFLQLFANQQLVLQDNGFTELTQHQKEFLQQHQIQQKRRLSEIQLANVLDSTVPPTIIEEKPESAPPLPPCPEIDETNKSMLALNSLNNRVLNDNVIKLTNDLKLLSTEAKKDQWQNLVIQENGLIQILNGKTDISTICQRDRNSCTEGENDSRVCDKNANVQRLLTLKFAQKDGQISEEDVCDARGETLTSCDGTTDNSILDRDLFIDNLLPRTEDSNNINVNVIGRFTVRQNDEQLREQEDAATKKTDTSRRSSKCRRSSEQHDEIVVRLLQKYCKYNQDAIDNEILNELEATVQERTLSSNSETTERMKLHSQFANDNIYENWRELRRFSLEQREKIQNERNEHVMKWLKEQNNHQHDCNESPRAEKRKSSVISKISSSNGDSRKSSVTSKSSTGESRKNSVTSNSEFLTNPESRKSSVTSTGTESGSEGEDSNIVPSTWQKLLKKHLGSNNLEKKFRRQRKAWARNTRKLSSASDQYCSFAAQL